MIGSIETVLAAGAALVLLAVLSAYRRARLLSAVHPAGSPVLRGVASACIGVASSGLLLLPTAFVSHSRVLLWGEFGALAALLLLSLRPGKQGLLPVDAGACSARGKSFVLLWTVVEQGWLAIVVLQFGLLLGPVLGVEARWPAFILTAFSCLCIVIGTRSVTRVAGLLLVGLPAVLLLCALTIFTRPEQFLTGNSIAALSDFGGAALLLLGFTRELVGLPQQNLLYPGGEASGTRRVAATSFMIRIAMSIGLIYLAELSLNDKNTAAGIASTWGAFQLMGDVASTAGVWLIANVLILAAVAMSVFSSIQAVQIFSNQGTVSVVIRLAIGLIEAAVVVLFIGWMNILRAPWTQIVELVYGAIFAVLILRDSAGSVGRFWKQDLSVLMFSWFTFETMIAFEIPGTPPLISISIILFYVVRRMRVSRRLV